MDTDINGFSVSNTYCMVVAKTERLMVDTQNLH